MLFQAKQALVFKAMYQSAFLAREKVLKFDGLPTLGFGKKKNSFKKYYSLDRP